MPNNASILDLIYLAHRRLAELESTPREFLPGELLHSSDIHTVVAVSRREGCNLTELAAAQEISVPAAFKSATKLVRSGYVVKLNRAGNAKEVAFHLSDKGRQALRRHEEFRRRCFGPLAALEAGLSEAERQTIRGFLQELNRACSW